MRDWIGWVATAVFALSYLPRSPQTLRRIQALAASLWIVYGVSFRAWPVVVANAVVAAMAVLSAHRKILVSGFARGKSFCGADRISSGYQLPRSEQEHDLDRIGDPQRSAEGGSRRQTETIGKTKQREVQPFP